MVKRKKRKRESRGEDVLLYFSHKQLEISASMTHDNHGCTVLVDSDDYTHACMLSGDKAEDLTTVNYLVDLKWY